MVFPQHYTLLCTCLCIYSYRQTNIWPEHFFFFLLTKQKNKLCIAALKGLLFGFSALSIKEGCALTQVILSCTCLHSWDEAKSHLTVLSLYEPVEQLLGLLCISLLNTHSTTDDTGRTLMMKQTGKKCLLSLTNTSRWGLYTKEFHRKWMHFFK